MEVVIEGVRIVLTYDQVAQIEKARKRREQCRTSFGKMLRHFGFKQMDTKDWEDKSKVCFEHEKNGWFAEIIDRGNYSDVFMVGQGLRQGSFPGGWIYGSQKEIEDELVKAINNLKI